MRGQKQLVQQPQGHGVSTVCTAATWTSADGAPLLPPVSSAPVRRTCHPVMVLTTLPESLQGYQGARAHPARPSTASTNFGARKRLPDMVASGQAHCANERHALGLGGGGEWCAQRFPAAAAQPCLKRCQVQMCFLQITVIYEAFKKFLTELVFVESQGPKPGASLEPVAATSPVS